MELKKGIKKTELGEIPNDWLDTEFGEVLTGFSSGQTPYRGIPKYYRGDIPWITSGELNYNEITDTVEKITDEAVRKTNLKIIPKGTFLFAITGLEAAGTRGSCALTGIEATTNQSCMALYPKDGKITTAFLYHFYRKHGNWLAFRYCQGTKQQSFTGGIAKKLPIVLPPTTKEQTAIATALSDADALIASLEKLIAKKRLIKQGVMQKLLKPKEEWEVKRLGDYATMYSGGTPNTSIPQYYGGDICWINSGDLNDPIITHVSGRITKEGLKNSSAKMVYENTLLIALYGATAGVVAISKISAAINQAVLAIIPKRSIDLKFLFYRLNLSKSRIIETFTQGGQPNLSGDIIKSLEFAFPSIEEQQRTSSILSDIDDEIFRLCDRLNKTKDIKTGMMKTLLTGKTRLI